MKRFLLVSLCFMSAIFSLYGQDSLKIEYRIIKDLSQESFIYHEKYESFIPYLKQEHGNTESLNWFVDKGLLQSKNAGLLIISKNDSIDVFINNQIVDTYTYGKEIDKMWLSAYQINSLSPKNSQPKITVYTSGDYLNPVQIQIAEKDVVLTAKQLPAQESLALQKRNINSIDNFVFIALVLMLIIILIIRVQFPKFFSSYFSISKLVFNITVDDQYLINKFNQPSVLLILFDALGISLYMTVMIFNDHWQQENFILWKKWSALGPEGFVNHYLIITLLIFLSFIIKYYYLAFINLFLKVTGAARHHYFQFKRLSTVSVIIVIPLFVVGYFAVPAFLQFLDKIVAGLVLIGLFHLLIVINKSASFRNLYLISYICTTEVLPLVVFIKIV